MFLLFGFIFEIHDKETPAARYKSLHNLSSLLFQSLQLPYSLLCISVPPQHLLPPILHPALRAQPHHGPAGGADQVVLLAAVDWNRGSLKTDWTF